MTVLAPCKDRFSALKRNSAGENGQPVTLEMGDLEVGLETVVPGWEATQGKCSWGCSPAGGGRP